MPTTLLRRSLRSVSSPATRRYILTSSISRLTPRPNATSSTQPPVSLLSTRAIQGRCSYRTFATSTPWNTDTSNQQLVNEKMEEIQELYATARDEFEIAAEETEKQTVYAEDDRKAAREELTKLQEAYKTIVEGNDKFLADEVTRRVGQRIRELENAVVAMEELAMSHD